MPKKKRSRKRNTQNNLTPMAFSSFLKINGLKLQGHVVQSITLSRASCDFQLHLNSISVYYQQQAR